MKKTLLLLFLLAFTSLHAQLSWQGGTNPEENDSATLLFDKTGTGLESYSGTIYAHTGVTLDDTDQWQNVIGTWGSNSTQPALTLVSGNIYELDLTPTIRDFYNNPTGSITSINVVFRSDDGSQQTVDLEISVGAFQVTMINPAPSANGVVIVDNGGGTQILAQNSNGPANYELFANGVSIHTQNNTTFYNGYFFSGLTENQYCELVVTQGAATTSRSFLILVNSTIEESIPSNLEDGINYNDSDPTTATLVIDAPNKDFVYVAGSFNNWEPTSTHAMKKDPSSSKFWVELTGLTSGQIETYQYWVGSLNPIAGSPKLVKTADPYSTLVLSPFDDPWISATTYPNLPAYPEGQEREVTVLETGQTPYAWQVTNFQKPKKEDLIIYEVLVRDFDQDRNFQDLIDKVDYFKDLNVNAIQLMPVMEFEGNESWGYNTSFHMALDKFYGTEEKFKELVDVFHQNGIAVILDIALNHAFGRNPMVRMWMDDPDGDGWGEPSSENPYFNQVAKHSYSVGSDFNHQQTRTQYYVERVVKHWIEEFNIDGFRWDLTKGFTQNCENNEGCTNTYQQDRVDILKQYADYSWSLDDTHYVIFEHLGQDNEEQEWANYRLNEDKGIMMWGIMNHDYNELTMGYPADINRMGHVARGFNAPRVVGYAESHDEERLMYKNLQFGNSSGGYDITNLNTALERMSALGAVTLTIPGPKMIWHFGELGMENSIFTCNNGTVNEPGGTDGDCKLDTKPQPQWVNNWIGDTNRSQIYNDWARLNELKINEDVFEGNYSIDSGDTTPRIYIWDDALPSTSLKNVVILANFDVTAQNIVPDFPYTGTWYDLMDDSGSTTITVSSTTATINIPAGEFRIYGNQASTLSIEDFSSLSTLKMFPNPTSNSFKTNKTLDKVLIYNTTGKLIYTFDGGFEKNHEFNVSNLSQGLYMVKLESNSNTTTRKLIIN
ncbi:alpha-amylase family glycosyl hydrolase [Meridianimaribacter flavus]|uniref:Secreted protein (Por secretion system target) n=1 Tax=Meridianimaribacter flavus TaxID=571115 RepID=A0ABY2G7X9_9FLAO|nr:alpha-amylase family glycosyl hydrolase [Meridianimaribacter flavus]TDY13913.1 putative secreted protein (Por secretion system target) [Meridianimaribacter flavus]